MRQQKPTRSLKVIVLFANGIVLCALFAVVFLGYMHQRSLHRAIDRKNLQVQDIKDDFELVSRQISFASHYEGRQLFGFRLPFLNDCSKQFVSSGLDPTNHGPLGGNQYTLFLYFSMNGCGSCVDKTLVRANEFCKKKPVKIRVIGIAAGGNRNHILRFFRINQPSFPVLLDSADITGQFFSRPQGASVLFVVDDREKTIVKCFLPVSRDVGKMEEYGFYSFVDNLSATSSK